MLDAILMLSLLASAALKVPTSMVLHVNHVLFIVKYAQLPAPALNVLMDILVNKLHHLRAVTLPQDQCLLLLALLLISVLLVVLTVLLVSTHLQLV